MLPLSYQPITNAFKLQLLTELWFGGISTQDVMCKLFFFCCLSFIPPPSISVQHLKRCESSVSPPPSSSVGPLLSDLWSSVPPSYRGYRLGSLVRHRHEIGHFKSFLEDQDARWVKSVEFDCLNSSFYLKNTNFEFSCASMWACLRRHVDNESNAPWQWHGFVIMWIFSVSIWVAGWILSSTEEPVRRSSGLGSQTNTLTATTSLDLRALPHHNSRMMWVTWFTFLTLRIIRKKKKWNHAVLKFFFKYVGKRRTGQKHGAHQFLHIWSWFSFLMILFLFSWQSAEFMLCNPWQQGVSGKLWYGSGLHGKGAGWDPARHSTAPVTRRMNCLLIFPSWG